MALQAHQVVNHVMQLESQLLDADTLQLEIEFLDVAPFASPSKFSYA